MNTVLIIVALLWWDQRFGVGEAAVNNEANSSPEAREGAPTNPDRAFDAEQGEIDQDGPTWEQP